MFRKVGGDQMVCGLLCCAVVMLCIQGTAAGIGKYVTEMPRTAVFMLNVLRHPV